MQGGGARGKGGVTGRACGPGSEIHTHIYTRKLIYIYTYTHTRRYIHTHFIANPDAYRYTSVIYVCVCVQTKYMYMYDVIAMECEPTLRPCEIRGKCRV